ncbi:hypothetical protein HDV57DRAFT_132903 [Trichoderma longibrachiatum]|uniref:Rhodopsin domain-containing protein n=1 Tax=Trichoderma longibrachiatum ATCC 18648 TaxID=983965 RepID=A0A2T4BRW2_TRILO|nr:hypothetical protein M440DRAFT_1342583 [Trichoderma longibrachiatum ATCC 18648]
MGLGSVEDYGVVANPVNWSLTALSTFIVILRLVCRACFARGRYGRLGLDDAITLACLVILIASSVCSSIGIGYGLGRRERTLAAEQLKQAIKWNAIINAVVIWSFSLPKFAIIAILKRILNYGAKTMAAFLAMAVVSQGGILAVSVWWFVQCRPVAHQWDPEVEGTCASVGIMTKLAFATTAYSAFLDLFFAFYPIPFIMKLNMPLKNRLAVCFALGLSAMASIVSIYKLSVFTEAFNSMAEDRTYSVPYLDIFGVAEGALLIIGASLPTLGPLFRLLKGKVTSYASSNTRSGDRSQNNPSTLTSSSRRHKRGDGTSKNNHQINNNCVADYEDEEEGVSTTGLHSQSSIDDIPLVATAKPVARLREYPLKEEMV